MYRCRLFCFVLEIVFYWWGIYDFIRVENVIGVLGLFDLMQVFVIVFVDYEGDKFGVYLFIVMFIIQRVIVFFDQFGYCFSDFVEEVLFFCFFKIKNGVEVEFVGIGVGVIDCLLFEVGYELVEFFDVGRQVFDVYCGIFNVGYRFSVFGDVG